MNDQDKKSQTLKTLNEAKRLHELCFGVHLLHGETREKTRAKTPLRENWTKPPREKWKSIEKSYRKGMGIGVALGPCSQLADGAGFLCVVDVDLKSDDPRHKAEAFAVVDANFPGLRESAPSVETGRGYHFYGRTAQPMQSGKIDASNEQVKIYSPSSELSKSQAAQLTTAEIKQDLRIKVAWEVEFMSEGRQVVLPTSKHPDNGNLYRWVKRLEHIDQLPWIKNVELRSTKKDANPHLEVLGYLLTLVDPTNMAGQTWDTLVASFGHQVFETKIRRSVKLREAPTLGKTIFHHAPESAGARDYLGLANEVMERLHIGEIGTQTTADGRPSFSVVEGGAQ